MPPRISDERRAAIVADIKTGDKGRNQIAKDHGVSVGSVNNIATEAGLTGAFDRSGMETATRALVADNKSRRAKIIAELLGDVERLRERAWSEHQQYERSMEGPQLVTLPLPPPRDVQALYTSIGIALQRHLEIDKHDSDTGTDAAKSMLSALAEGLGAAYDRLNAPGPDTSDTPATADSAHGD